jgi:hypothetical protein
MPKTGRALDRRSAARIGAGDSGYLGTRVWLWELRLLYFCLTELWRPCYDGHKR